MNAEKLRTYLETTTNLVVVGAVIFIAATFAWGFIAQRSPPELRGGLQKGKPFASPASVNFNAAGRTLVLAINSKCGYCHESIPFYKHLFEITRENNVQVIAVSSEEENILKEYLSQTQLSIASSSPVDLASYGITVTPTVIMVDGKGVILDFWVGKLSRESEQQIVEAVINDQNRGGKE